MKTGFKNKTNDLTLKIYIIQHIIIFKIWNEYITFGKISWGISKLPKAISSQFNAYPTTDDFQVT